MKVHTFRIGRHRFVLYSYESFVIYDRTTRKWTTDWMREVTPE